MSHLRQQLQETRRTYQSLRYPGDLVADVRRSRPARPVRWVIGLSALAALIVISLGIYSRLSSVAEPSVSVAEIEPTVKTEIATTDIESARDTFEFAPPSAPEGVNFVPSFASLNIPASFGIPAWDATTSTTSPTTKESL